MRTGAGFMRVSLNRGSAAGGDVRVDRKDVPREKVIWFYVTYDRGKKGGAVPADLATWPWHDPDRLDRKLTEHGLKRGVMAAYRTWISAQLSVADLLECAVVSDIFPGEPRALGQLAWIFTPSRELTLRTVFVSGG